MPCSANWLASAMIEFVLADTLHTLVSRLPDRVWCGTRTHHARVLGHVNRRDPLKDLLLTHIGTDPLITQLHHPPTFTTADGADHPRVRRGTEI
jgi:hypothetical protein